MRFDLRLFTCLGLLASLGCPWAGAAPQSPYVTDAATWPQEASDLPAAPEATFGQLANGLRYVILPHQEPPGRLSLRLLIESGSLMETDAQRGVAHFLEHMAFNGSKNIEPGKLVELFQNLGMAFGADTNAHTTFDETVYKFEVPDLKPKTLDTALLAMRDYADGLLLLPEEFERERGVILSEMRDRDSADYRAGVDGYAFSLPYSLVPDRLPIGTADALKGQTAADARAFYERWYTLDRMAIVVVGDVEPAAIVPQLEKHFGSMQAPAVTLPDPDLGELLPRGEALSVYVDPELTATEVNLATARPAPFDRDGSASRFHQLCLDAANVMLDRRLEELAKAEGAPFTMARSYGYTAFNFAEFAGVFARTSPEQWPEALAVIEQELRRTLEHGFNQSELDYFVAMTENDFETAVQQAPSRQSRDLANEITALLSEGSVYQSPEQQRARFAAIKDQLTPTAVLEAWRAVWANEDRLLRLETQQPVEDGYVKLRQTYHASLEKPVEPYADRELGEFAYQDWGQPGKIVAQTPVADLDATRVEFANHVVLFVKRTPFEQGKLRVAARFGLGELDVPADKPGLPLFTEATFTAGGLEAHSVDDLARLLAGRNVGVGFSIGDQGFALGGTTTPADLKLQLDLMAAYLTHPGYRDEAARRFKASLPQVYQPILHTVDGVTADRVEAFLAGGDYRFGFAPMDAVASRTLDEAKAWLTPALQQSKLELAIVGDIDPQAAIDAVAATFGALPTRAATLPKAEKLRDLNPPTPPQKQVVTYSTELSKARVIVAWPTVDMDDIFLNRRLSMLAEIFDDRMRVKIREAAGEAYSPYAYNLSSETFDGFGYLRAVVDCDPAKAEEIADLLVKIGDELATEGFTPEEFQRLLEPRLRGLEQQQRSNAYWLNRVLLGADSRPEMLEWSRSLFKDYPNMKVDQVLPLAEHYLEPERAIRILILPKAAE